MDEHALATQCVAIARRHLRSDELAFVRSYLEAGVDYAAAEFVVAQGVPLPPDLVDAIRDTWITGKQDIVAQVFVTTLAKAYPPSA